MVVKLCVIVKMVNVMNNLTYETFKEIFDGEKNLSDKPIVMDFYADWCGPCKMFEPIFDKVAEEYKNKIIFYKVDSEKNQELSVMFRVMSIPTIVMISKGGEVTINPGALTEDTFKYYLEGLISKN